MSSTQCAWCLAERGIKTRGSHGICAKHHRQMMCEAKKAQKQKQKQAQAGRKVK